MHRWPVFIGRVSDLLLKTIKKGMMWLLAMRKEFPRFMLLKKYRQRKSMLGLMCHIA